MLRERTKRRTGLFFCLFLGILAVPAGWDSAGRSVIGIKPHAPAPGRCPTLGGGSDFGFTAAEFAAHPELLFPQTDTGRGTPVPLCSSSVDCIKQAEQFIAGFAGDRAEAPLERAIALDHSSVRAYRDLVLVYMRRSQSLMAGSVSLDPASKEDYGQAESACRTALALAPDDAQLLLLLGEIINRQVEHGYRTDVTAIEPLKRAIEVRPDCPDLYSEIAYAYRLADRYEDAIAAYNKDAALRRERLAMEPQMDEPSAESERQRLISDALTVADLYSKAGKRDLALEPLQRAEVLDPDDYSIHSLLGQTYVRLGDIESARKELELLTKACGSTNKFVVYRCELAVTGLEEAIQKSR
jgi:Flp pilus assembly protein TadD